MRLVEEARARRITPLRGREAAAAWLLAVPFAIVACALPLLAPASGAPPAFATIAVLIAFVAASRVEFEIGTGIAIPTEVAFVPVLLALPPSWVPLSIGLLALVAEGARRDGLDTLRRAPVVVSSCWYSVGPAIVLVIAHSGPRGWPVWYVVAGALVAQVVCDAIANLSGEWIATGIRPVGMLRFLAWAYAVDATLAPIGLAVAFADHSWAPATLATLPLVALLAMFARERRRRFDHAFELGRAYRGTAFLLGEMLEADDAYTGRHSRDVVELAVAVAEELGLDEAAMRDIELTALLHDVGKIRVPTEIVRKPGPLTPAERALIETHTIEGEDILKRVGGLLSHIGAIVRSCHERWDGAGYPDGLAAHAIPLAARIVFACDAFNAMTTERPYRAARPVAHAVRELQAGAGTQFDPAVVRALAAVAARFAGPDVDASRAA